MKHVLNVDAIESIDIVVADEKIIDDTKKNVEFYLWKKSATDKFADVLFQIRTNKDQLKQINNIIGKMSLLLAGI
jgi:patatin-like phospholipase/acyl hydrolase|tara:strand:+ start:355 stop:579 length:225 start_codon:yes stop_codon:yes gene_type:complete